MLFLVPTPIGNLAYISLRALEVLKSCDLIAAEDTRHTSRLLQHYDIKKPLLSLHEHNEAARTDELETRLTAGAQIAIVSDAGTPLISDPGYRIIRRCIEKQIPYTVLPGPSAVITALTGSGLPPYPFYFGGFLPVKSGRKQRELEDAIKRNCTSIYFESPHRLLKTLDCLHAIAPQAQACVARELTKAFETFHHGTPSTLLQYFQNKSPKGEITLVISNVL